MISRLQDSTQMGTSRRGQIAIGVKTGDRREGLDDTLSCAEIALQARHGSSGALSRLRAILALTQNRVRGKSFLFLMGKRLLNLQKPRTAE
jgi:hypothetical protein